jgi:hypothetical protein
MWRSFTAACCCGSISFKATAKVGPRPGSMTPSITCMRAEKWITSLCMCFLQRAPCSGVVDLQPLQTSGHALCCRGARRWAAAPSRTCGSTASRCSSTCSPWPSACSRCLPPCRSSAMHGIFFALTSSSARHPHLHSKASTKPLGADTPTSASCVAWVC